MAISIDSRIGHFEQGQIRITNHQKKKHFSQMSERELRYLRDKLSNIEIQFSRHLTEKLDLFAKSDFVNSLECEDNASIIEYNETPLRNGMDFRVLLRTKNSQMVQILSEIVECQLCFVVSIISGQIITAYWNKVNDNHQSISMNRYDTSLIIEK